MISASDVSFSYGSGLVVSGAGLQARPGEVIGLIGPNGSGKTTMLKILCAALDPAAGIIELDERSIDSFSVAELARRLGQVAQESPPEIPLTVAEMVLLGRSPHRRSLQRYAAEDYQIAAAALTRVGLRNLAERSFAQLSGGEKQRVLIARTLAQQTDHLLFDEPTNHLDIRYQHDLLDLVRGLGVTTVLVLHDLNLAARYCNQLVLLDRGTVVATGPPEQVLTPEILQPVYKVAVRRVDDADCVQLVFSPANRPASPLDQDGRFLG